MVIAEFLLPIVINVFFLCFYDSQINFHWDIDNMCDDLEYIYLAKDFAACLCEKNLQLKCIFYSKPALLCRNFS